MAEPVAFREGSGVKEDLGITLGMYIGTLGTLPVRETYIHYSITIDEPGEPRWFGSVWPRPGTQD